MAILKPVTIHVLYYMPSYSHLLNEFTWQTEDRIPEMPKLYRFMKHFTTLAVVQNFIISTDEGWHRRINPVTCLKVLQ